MKPKTLIGMLLFVLLTFCAGCETVGSNFNYVFGTDQNKPNSTELAEIQFSDVPVPKNFILQTSENESFSVEDAGYRSGVLKYIGSGSREAIARYYETNMPSNLYGWTAGNHSSAGREETLTFHKEKDTCTVKVLEESGKIHLTILMAPKK